VLEVEKREVEVGLPLGVKRSRWLPLLCSDVRRWGCHCHTQM
jgi:hypothetical protein